ncbi:MAG: LOG family protein [Pirellulales bacterium]
MDELFEILTWKQLQLHSKPVVILLNVNGFYDFLARLLQNMVEEGFLKPHNYHLLQFANSVDHLFQLLDTYLPSQPEGKWIDQQLV